MKVKPFYQIGRFFIFSPTVCVIMHPVPNEHEFYFSGTLRYIFFSCINTYQSYFKGTLKLVHWKDDYAKQLLLTQSVHSENYFSGVYESLTKILSYPKNSVSSQNQKKNSIFLLIILFLQDFLRSQIFLVLFPSLRCILKKHCSPQESQKVKEPRSWLSHFCSFQ